MNIKSHKAAYNGGRTIFYVFSNFSFLGHSEIRTFMAIIHGCVNFAAK